MMAPELIGFIMSLLLFKVKLLLSLSLALLLLLLLFSAVVLLAVFLAPLVARLVFFFGCTKFGSQRTSTGFGQPGISIVLKVGGTVTGVFRGRGGVFAVLALATATATTALGAASSTPEEIVSVGGTEVSTAVEIGAELETVFPVVFALPKFAVRGGGSTTTSPLFSSVMEIGGGVIFVGGVIIVGVVEVSCMMPGG